MMTDFFQNIQHIIQNITLTCYRLFVSLKKRQEKTYKESCRKVDIEKNLRSESRSSLYFMFSNFENGTGEEKITNRCTRDSHRTC